MRRTAVLAAALAAVLAGCGEGPGESAAAADPAAAGAGGAPRPPHIVVYMVDTLRADRVGVYGAPRDTTPFLDEVARDAAVFEHAVAQAPWTLPSCVSLQTSSYPANHGVVSARHKAPEEIVTIPELLRERGYVTAGFVHNLLGGSHAGLDQGYDVLVERPQTKDLTDADRERGLNTLRPLYDWIAGQDGSQPLYVYIHTVEPHHPYEGTMAGGESFAPVDEARRARLNELPGEHRGVTGTADLAAADDATRARHAALEAELLAGLDALWALYDGDVRRADEHVARVVAALRRQGLWDDTVFVFLSDHGEEMYEHGSWFHDQSVYEELVHVPLVLRVPGLTDVGVRIAQPVELVDLAPTLAELAGARPDPRWLGRSLLPDVRAALAGGARGPTRPVFSQRVNEDRAVATIRALRGDRETAVIDDDLKAILHHDTDRLSLYDLAADAGEQRDLAAQRPGDAARLRDLIERFLDEQRTRTFPARRELELGDERLEAFRQLGYVDGEGGGAADDHRAGDGGG